LDEATHPKSVTLEFNDRLFVTERYFAFALKRHMEPLLPGQSSSVPTELLKSGKAFRVIPSQVPLELLDK
jgi:hypothetical protein